MVGDKKQKKQKWEKIGATKSQLGFRRDQKESRQQEKNGRNKQRMEKE